MRVLRSAIIVGAGVGGLATAIRLSAKPYKVVVHDTNPYPGGKLTTFEQTGYRFDAGPSLFTMPWLVDELFELHGKNPGKYFQYSRMDETCRYFWDDGTRLIAWENIDRFAREVERTLGVPARTTLRKMEKSQRMYELTGKTFMEKPLHKLSTWLSRDVARALGNLGRLSLFSTMHEENLAMLQNPKLVQLFDRFATYNGSSPYKAPGLLNMIPYLEHGLGTFLPLGGMHDITQSLYNLAVETGVEFRLDDPVEKILVEKNKVTGIQAKSGRYQADIVVSNADITPTYRQLLPGIKPPRRALEQEKSTSALIFYWGIKKVLDELGSHNILFSNRYKEEFDSLVGGHIPFDDPTIYISITSRVVKSDAPPGKDNWFVMINVPHDIGQDWESAIPVYREAIIKKISLQLGIDIRPLIETESILEPRLIEKRTSSAGGALYGASSNNRFAAFLRHANESSTIEGLYFCGGSVHPGGGIPLCLLSAKIVNDLIPEP